MGVVRAQTITEDRASGAQVIDGSLKFTGNSCLTRTFSSSGDRRTWTWSGWVKRGSIPTSNVAVSLFGAYSDGSNRDVIRVSGATQDALEFQNGISADYDSSTTSALLRDTGWYHFVIAVDADQGTQTDRVKIYVNGELQSKQTDLQLTRDTITNHNVLHLIGARSTDGSPSAQWDGYMSQVYFVDGQQLAPTEFGFTDGLTNTWRPKKYTGTYGTNGFYLPMDGNSPIGEDKSGNGNNFTPINFGGSNTIEKATGAFPILNTDDGGNAARLGTRTDAYASNLVLALPLVSDANDISNRINSGSTTKTVTLNGNVAASSAQSNFYSGSFVFGGTGDYLSFNSSSDLAFGTDPYTVEMWVNPSALPGGGILFSNSSNNGFVTNMDTGGIAINQYGIGDKVATSEGIPLNQWSHLAFVREGTGTDQAKIYVNGVVRATGTDATDWTVTTNPGFGANIAHGGQPIQAHAQDLRVYKGVAKYTSNFIPASTDPDILPDTPSGVAGGSALDKIISGSVCFAGLGSHIKIDSSSDFAFGTGDFTIEGWYYIRESGSNNAAWDFRGGAGNTYFLKCINDANGRPTSWNLRNNSGSVAGFSADSNVWNHIAVSRTSGTLKIFVNGIETNSVSDTYNASGSGPVFINTFYNQEYANPVQSYGLDGFISNFRVIKGTGLYTSNFTPPTEPLTVITNTVLLCCQSSTSITASAITPNTITTKTDYLNEGTLSAPRQSNLLGDLFNGSTTGFWGNSQVAGEVTYTFPSGIAFTKLEIAGSNYNGHYAKVNGTTFTNWGTTFNPPPWHNITSSVSSPLTSITVAGNGGQTSTMSAIRINDTIYLVNNYTKASTFNPFTTDIDESRGQETGWCTLNPVSRERSGGGTQNSSVTLSNGNLSASVTTDSGVRATMAVSSGKWYYEATKTSTVEHSDGVGWESYGVPTDDYYVYYRDNGSIKVDNVHYPGQYETYTYGDLIGAALDLDNNTVTFYKNGRKIFSRTANTSATEPWGPGLILRYGAGSGAASSFDVNFGQKPFKYAPPEGHKTLCLANLPRSTAIARPDKYFKTVLYTGNTTSQSITGVGFQPDFVWVKKRNGFQDHEIQDSVRGATNSLSTSNLTSAETTDSQSITSFTSDGFNIGSSNSVNENRNYVAWCWQAGGNSNTFNVDGVGYATASDAGITDGTIALTGASVNTAAGFSILTFTGQSNAGSIAHGLSKKPSFIIGKNRDRTTDWKVYFPNTGEYGDLSNTNAQSSVSNGYTGATSSLINLQGSGYGLNYATDNQCVIYCWTEIEGFSKFGSYSGNNNADGPFVYCGFKPAWVLIRNMSISEDWVIFDNERGSINPLQQYVRTNSGAAESSAGTEWIDFLSNGFKLKTVSTLTNPNGNTIIYAAFAEAPSFNLYGGQANAR